METLIVQIGLRQGRSADIHKLADRELYLGRAYSNDIVLTDPYVAPQQLRIYRYGTESDEMSWHINVLDSTNPVLLNGEPLNSATAEVKPGDTITVGRTQLRLYSDEQAVEPTRKLLVSSWLHSAARSIAIPLAVFFTVCLLDSLLSYFFANTDGDWKEHGLGTLTGMVVLLGWAGAWAVVGRLLRHQPHFAQQLLVSSVIAGIGILISPLEVYAEFLSDNTALQQFTAYLSGTLLFAYLLHFNLFFATNIKHTAIIAFCFTISMVGLALLFSLADDEEFESSPDYSRALLAPAVNPRTGSDLQDYLGSMDKALQQAQASDY